MRTNCASPNFVIFALACCFLYAAPRVTAQSVSPQPQKSFFEVAREQVFKNSTDKLIGFGSTLIIAIWQWSKRKRALKVHFTDKKPIERIQTVLVLGESRTGKTTLVKNLFGFPTDQQAAPAPYLTTTETHLYGIVHETKTAKENRVYRFDVVDYRGGDLGSMVRTWPSLKKEMLQPNVSFIVLILEVYDSAEKDRAENSFSVDHLQAQVGRWSTSVLSTLAPIISNDVDPTVVVFVNKADLIPRMTLPTLHSEAADRLDEIAQVISPLQQALQQAFRTAEVDVVVGSLVHGVGVNKLMSLLMAKAKPI